jgi:hypothetical protein
VKVKYNNYDMHGDKIKILNGSSRNSVAVYGLNLISKEETGMGRIILVMVTRLLVLCDRGEYLDHLRS